MSTAIDKLQDLWNAWDQGSMIGMADTINAIRPALDEMTAARAEIARLTAELAAARAVPGDVEAALHNAECRNCGNSWFSDDQADLFRTAIARAIREAADARGTVGGQAGPVGKLLGSHAIVEWYLAPDWYQARIGQDGYGMVRRADLRRRHENARTWSSWGQPWGDPAQHMDQPARLVTADQADLDPATRCPLPKGG